MFCINCIHTKTRVSNSRPSKKTPQIWRRRVCDNCGTIFTTIETADVKISVVSNATETHFSRPRLAMNLAGYLTNELHNNLADSAFWLAKTVEQNLIMNRLQKVSLHDLTKITHEILGRYDPTAGVLYGTNYGLISPTAKPRRGRPSYR